MECNFFKNMYNIFKKKKKKSEYKWLDNFFN